MRYFLPSNRLFGADLQKTFGSPVSVSTRLKKSDQRDEKKLDLPDVLVKELGR